MQPSGDHVAESSPAARATQDGTWLRTRTLLACGIATGPLYVAVTLAQALTRAGFDLRQHRFTLLTTGELGWLHQPNMCLVGAGTILFALGASRVLLAVRHEGTVRGATWGPRLLGLLGAAYLFGGLLSADAVAGFPPGTTTEQAHVTLQGMVQNASRGVSSLLLVAASLTIATWFAARGQTREAWVHRLALPATFAMLTVAGTTIGGNPSAIAFLATPWIWVTFLALQLSRLETRQRAVVAQ